MDNKLIKLEKYKIKAVINIENKVSNILDDYGSFFHSQTINSMINSQISHFIGQIKQASSTEDISIYSKEFISYIKTIEDELLEEAKKEAIVDVEDSFELFIDQTSFFDFGYKIKAKNIKNSAIFAIKHATNIKKLEKIVEKVDLQFENLEEKYDWD